MNFFIINFFFNIVLKVFGSLKFIERLQFYCKKMNIKPEKKRKRSSPVSKCDLMEEASEFYKPEGWKKKNTKNRLCY